ncbi:hypothetical protein Tco_1007101 [Tanacetum coccineum]
MASPGANGTALELAGPEQTATGKDVSNLLNGCDGLPKTVRVFQFTLDSRSKKLDWLLLHQDWTLLPHLILLFIEFMLVLLMLLASLVSAACVPATAYFVPAALPSSCFEKIYLETWN